jgi:hypothetical protein
MASLDQVQNYMQKSDKAHGTLLQGGALGGILAGMLMLLAMMIGYAFRGFPVPHTLKLISATIMGEGAVTGSFGAIFLGLLLHLMTASAWGIIFAYLIANLKSFKSLLVSAISFGFAVWLLMGVMTLPVLNPVMAERMGLVPIQWLMVHLVYGLGLVFVPLLEAQDVYED